MGVAFASAGYAKGYRPTRDFTCPQDVRGKWRPKQHYTTVEIPTGDPENPVVIAQNAAGTTFDIQWQKEGQFGGEMSWTGPDGTERTETFHAIWNPDCKRADGGAEENRLPESVTFFWKPATEYDCAHFVYRQSTQAVGGIILIEDLQRVEDFRYAEDHY